MWQHTCGVYVWHSVWRCNLDCVQFELRTVMAMWQHTCGVYVWRSVWRCKLDCVQFELRTVMAMWQHTVGLCMYGALCSFIQEFSFLHPQYFTHVHNSL